MATIVYSMCGEGRGHATRVQTIVEAMLPKHRFILLAARDAYHQLYDRYQDNPLVSVRRLPGLFFSYRGQKVDYGKSIVASVPYLWKLRALTRYVSRMMERDRPALAITDFEPILPRAARKLGIPWISLDHQHFLSVSDFSDLPWRFRWRGLFLRGSIPLFYSGQAGEAVSSFYHLPSRPGTETTLRIGVLLRQNILDFAANPPAPAGHILVYIRRHAPANLWETLERSGRPSIVYGLGERLSTGSIQFKKIAEHEFVRDLASAECLVSTAGNQLVGEAFHLNKPVLAIPEDGNFEQELNAWLVKKSGGGWSTSFQELTPHYLQQFLLAVPSLRRRLEHLSVCGNKEAIEFISRFLPEPSAVTEHPFLSPNVWEPESATL